MAISSLLRLGEWVKVFNDTFLHCLSCFDLRLLTTPLVSSTFYFNSISVLSSCRSVSLFGDTGILGENHRHVASHCKDVSHQVVSSTYCHERDSN